MSRHTITTPIEIVDARMDDGAVIRLRRYGVLDRPRIILSHGNGFAIDGYFPYWSLLLSSFEIVVFDFRNYGRNPVHEGTHDYVRFLADMTILYDAIDSAFGKKSQAGVFHSMSARVNLKYALDGHRRLDALVVFDPPMVPMKEHPLYERLLSEERLLWRWSAVRPEYFDDPTELAGLYSKSHMLSGWVSGSYELMARSVLRYDVNKKNWFLVCNPARESHIYRQNTAMNIWPAATEFPLPVLVVGGDPDSTRPSAASHACRALGEEQGWIYQYVPGTNHFLQLQEPTICADLTSRFLYNAGVR